MNLREVQPLRCIGDGMPASYNFQPSCAEDYGFVFHKDRNVCMLCFENVCRTSCVKRHFETKHKRSFKERADKGESIKRAVSRYGKQVNSLKVFATAKKPCDSSKLLQVWIWVWLVGLMTYD